MAALYSTRYMTFFYVFYCRIFVAYMQAESGKPTSVLSIEDVWVIPLLRVGKITARLSLKYAKLSVELFYDR